MNEFDVSGLIEKLNVIVDDETIRKALNRACIVVENKAKEKCPVDTGELRRSITHEVEDKTGIIGTNLSYAPYVEYGTGLFSSMGNGRQDRWCYQSADGEWHSTIGQQPQPYLHPALTESTSQIRDVIVKTIKEEINA